MSKLGFAVGLGLIISAGYFLKPEGWWEIFGGVMAIVGVFIAERATTPTRGMLRDFEWMLDYFNGGAGLIAQERKRQVDSEKYSLEHDDQHAFRELASAAAAYAVKDQSFWPWDPKGFKIDTTSTLDAEITNMTKAGALIAAEIDRLKRRQERGLGVLPDLVDWKVDRTDEEKVDKLAEAVEYGKSH